MAVSLQEFVAIFIAALYNLCKTYLGNRPPRPDPIFSGWPGKLESWQKQGLRIVERKDVKIARYTDSHDNPIFMGEIDGRTFGERYKTKEEAQASIDEMKPFILTDKYRHPMGQFDTIEEAQEAARDKVKRENKPKINEKGISVESAERIGTPRREPGENITTDRLRETFGFKGVNFGNWMKGNANEAERQLHLNHAYDSFMDLAEILNVPPKAISLNGFLGVAFGAQGSGAHAAHFVPGVNEINLTRTAGAGAMAHEWGHALDHYFANQAGLESSRAPYITESVGSYIDSENIRPEIVSLFNKIVHAMNKKTINVSPEEQAQQFAARKEDAKRRVNLWLKSIKEDFILNKVTEEDFEKLADKIRNNDLGEGRVAVSGGFSMSPVVSELRNLYKEKAGRVYSLDQIKGLQSNIDYYKYIAEKEKEEHIPQTKEVITDYSKESAKLDKGKSKAYWGTEREMFARAFDAFITDTIEEKSAKNTYLSGIEAIPPKGEERKAINQAFRNLIEEIKTRETDKGVEMYSVRGIDNQSNQEYNNLKGEQNGRQATDNQSEGRGRNNLVSPDAQRHERKVGIQRSLILQNPRSPVLLREECQKGRGIVHDPNGYNDSEFQEIKAITDSYGIDLIPVTDTSNNINAFIRGKNLFLNMRRGPMSLMEAALHELSHFIGNKITQSKIDTLSEAYLKYKRALSKAYFNSPFRALPDTHVLEEYAADLEAGIDTNYGVKLSSGLKKGETVATVSKEGQSVRTLQDLYDIEKYMTAWHGSPHTFDKFSTDKIRTGQGAQSYGYGLYFAGKREVAEYYKKQLANKYDRLAIPLENAANLIANRINLKTKERGGSYTVTGRDIIDMMNGVIDRAIEYDDSVKYWLSESPEDRFAAAAATVYEYSPGILEGILDKEGRLYKVELAPAEDEYLLWDKPLSEQSEKVKEALKETVLLKQSPTTVIVKNTIDEDYLEADKFRFDSTEEAESFAKTQQKKGKFTEIDYGEVIDRLGGQGYGFLAEQLGSDKSASDYLYSLGIRGIKYLDWMSRRKGEGDYNYVIFSDDDVEIKEMYSVRRDVELKAPNGQKSKLTPFQWAQVRTKAFKKWFGDWEAVAKATPLRKAATFAEAKKQAEEYIGTPIKNIDTGIIATVSKTNIEKMFSNSAVNKSTNAQDHALAVANADQLFQHAYLDETHPDKNNDPTIVAIHRFVSPMITTQGNVIAVKMTVKETSSPKNPIPLYSIQAIEIEKLALDAPQASFSNKVVSLLRSVKPDSVSKVVDENGEPLVVYHGTNADFNVFDPAKIGTATDSGQFGKGFYFHTKHGNGTKWAGTSGAYATGEGGNIMPVYLSLKNPYITHQALWNRPIPEGYTGVIVYDKPGGVIDEIVAFHPIQIKSATANTGTFDKDNPDIRFAVNQPSPYSMPTLADVQEVFKGQKVTQLPTGAYLVTLKNGANVVISEVSEITPNGISLNIGYSKSGLSEKEAITGSYRKGHIKLVKGQADKWTLAHESVHFMEDIGVINDQEVKLLQRHIQNLTSEGQWNTLNKDDIGGSEDRAEFLAEALQKEPKGLLGRIINKIQDFIDKLVNAFGIRTIRGIQRDIKTGKVYGRETNEQREARLDLETGVERSLAGLYDQEKNVSFSIKEGEGNQNYRSFALPSTIGDILTSYFNINQVKAHADYAAAKAGDKSSAARLIKALVKDETVKAARSRFGKNAIYVYPHSIEEKGMNMIPAALANYYGKATHLIQTNKAYHTGANAMERLISRVSFAGDIIEGGKYVLVNDVTTLGSTFGEMAHYIQDNGGEVVGIITLTNASRQRNIIPTKSVIKEIERRYGNEIRELFGIDPKALTAAEAGYLIGFRDADTLRNRAVAAVSERRQRLLSKGIRLRETLKTPQYAIRQADPHAAYWNLEKTKYDTSLYNLVDKYIDVKDVISAIKRFTHGIVEEAKDVYLKVTNYSGRLDARYKEFMQEEFQPVMEALAKAGISREQFEEFLLMRHAKEANAYYRRNKGTPDGGSGVLDAQVDAYFRGEKVTVGEYTFDTLSPEANAKMQPIADMVDGITHKSAQTLLDYGVESQNTIGAWLGSYQHYVPLSRDDDPIYGRVIPTGFSVSGPSSARRQGGSDKMPLNILANIFDKNFLFVGGSIGTVHLCVKDILATRCGVLHGCLFERHIPTP
ncbi:MAG: hypothetical protein QUS13_12245, partial [Smithella sp.]|nr:hypothetical protein [Smithella sp.]